MLDINHPMTEHIFAAGGLLHKVIESAKRMSAACQEDRLALQQSCRPVFESLRELARTHFAELSRIPPAIDELEKSLDRIANLPGVPQRGDPKRYQCPACNADLERRGHYGMPAPQYPKVIYCSRCLENIGPELALLNSWEHGFGIDLI